MIVLKTRTDLEKMRRSGLLVHRILRELEGMVQEGVSTGDLEEVAENMIREAGAAGLQGLLRGGGQVQVPLRAVHLGERGDRAWDALP